jgi:DNA invertase Pin-like site-specific DNA recombinase
MIVVRRERQLALIAKAEAEGKRVGGRKPGTRISRSVEKEALIQQSHAHGQATVAIVRLAGLSRKSVYKTLETARMVA